MTADPSAQHRESLFVWTSGGIRHIQKKIKRIFFASKSLPPPADVLPAEQRNYPRLDLRLPILYKVVGEGASRIPPHVRPFLLARSTNVSPIGLCLNLEEELPRDTVLILTIHLLNSRQKFSAVGRVVWARAAEPPDHFLTGLQFVVVDKNNVELEEHARMADLVRRLSGG